MDIKGETIQNGEPSPEHPVEIENKINLTGAIQILNKLKSKVTLVEADEKEYRLPFLINIEQQAIETVLSELEKKEAIINEMSKFIANLKLSWFKKEDGGEFLGKYRFYNQEEWIEYFTNKVEREGK